jgi:hypothetical protein
MQSLYKTGQIKLDWTGLWEWIKYLQQFILVVHVKENWSSSFSLHAA